MEKLVIQRIRSIIKSERISISALSKMIDMPQATLNRQISGESAMTLDTFISIMNCFPKVSLDWVLRGDGIMINGEDKANGNYTEKKFVVCVDKDGYLKLEE